MPVHQPQLLFLWLLCHLLQGPPAQNPEGRVTITSPSPASAAPSWTVWCLQEPPREAVFSSSDLDRRSCHVSRGTSPGREPHSPWPSVLDRPCLISDRDTSARAVRPWGRTSSVPPLGKGGRPGQGGPPGWGPGGGQVPPRGSSGCFPRPAPTSAKLVLGWMLPGLCGDTRERGGDAC